MTASLISSVVFPTPEKTIFWGFILTCKAFTNSPPETISAPAPNLDSNDKIPNVEFALRAKFISVFVSEIDELNWL